MTIAYDTSDGTIMEALNNKADIDLNNLSADDKMALIKENKETVMGWMMPDYANGVNKGTSFTSDGYYMMYVTQTFTSSGSQGVTIKINNNTMSYSTGGNWGAWVCPFIIKPNDIVVVSTTGSSISATCYPLGVN